MTVRPPREHPDNVLDDAANAGLDAISAYLAEHAPDRAIRDCAVLLTAPALDGDPDGEEGIVGTTAFVGSDDDLDDGSGPVALLAVLLAHAKTVADSIGFPLHIGGLDGAWGGQG
jgi:hypothetical protein